jgi:hypothetical protein
LSATIRYMIFIVISVVVPIIIAIGLPQALQKYGYKNERKLRPLLYVACALFFISYYLPSPLIEGRDTAFMTHLIGGGVFTGLLWVYLKAAVKWRTHWAIGLFSAYALVSALGCLNELAELAIVKFHLFTMKLDDTNWDILANTLGLTLTFIGYKLYDRWHR